MESESDKDIEKLRAEMDEIDLALVQLMAKRRDIAVEIAQVKQSVGSVNDEDRLREVLGNVQKKAQELGLDEEEMKELWKCMITYMIKEQMKKYPY